MGSRGMKLGVKWTSGGSRYSKAKFILCKRQSPADLRFAGLFFCRKTSPLSGSLMRCRRYRVHHSGERVQGYGLAEAIDRSQIPQVPP